MVEEFKLFSEDKRIMVEFDETIYLSILKIVYTRDKELFSILKSKYEQLTQKEFKLKFIHKNKL